LKRGGSIVTHLRILLAEDNELNQKVTLAMLKHLGYKACTALNGIEVLHALERRRYDLILMNIGMPLLDGIGATWEIRRRWPNGPRIVALTARVLPEMKDKCFEAGMDDYIAKPVQLRELAEVLKKCSLEAQ
jgi:CheY-like chemotaxis protein